MIRLEHGDCLDVMRGLIAEGVQVDSVCCDPPYHLTSIVKRFGAENAAPAKFGTDGAFARASRGFMGKAWDGGDIAFQPEVWRLCFDLLKPGGHLVAFGGTRTYHRMACAIEDAGFEIRDQLAWVYAVGMPKGQNTQAAIVRNITCLLSETASVVAQCSKSILLHCGETKGSIAVAYAQILPEGKKVLLMEIGGAVALHDLTVTLGSMLETASTDLSMIWSWNGSSEDAWRGTNKCITETISETIIDLKTWNSLIGLHTSETTIRLSVTLPNGWLWPAVTVGRSSIGANTNKNGIPIVTALGGVTWNPVAKLSGFNIALKPSWEPIVLARKPLIGTVVENVLKHGTGAINIDACRVGDEVRHAAFTSLAPCSGNPLGEAGTAEARRGTQGEPKEYIGRWPANLVHDGSDEVVSLFPTAPGQLRTASSDPESPRTRTVFGKFDRSDAPMEPRGDSGSAARFFYSAKANAKDRCASKHPTVKPVALMKWLTRMITPPGGTVLDPFAGSGTTGQAALEQGFSAILIEREGEYFADIRRRLKSWLSEALVDENDDSAILEVLLA